MGLFDFFTKRTLSKAEINSILEREWHLQKPLIDQIVITECEKLVNKEDLIIILESGLHKEFVSKILLDLFIDNFGYQLGAIHGLRADVVDVPMNRNTTIINSFKNKINALNQNYPFKDSEMLKNCYEQIAMKVCTIGQERGKENYYLFKDTIIRK
ncbi:hypothetical protein QE429_000635 [Bacillus sp. SORGH_AS 510]|uniref:hypothetical protein n=1 Tax=Bacillus sp. SORGH_AS_0510 TaxID=3041771 RepID=UPI00278617F4|nr:hypothetical protein [Bacillus sp. SORGH_AS_0510]MDQ1143808.1 hypothetical protein [Bacillus sp. SORGH_AS_0510]